jgi:arylsulfatase A-like enzyme
MAALRESGQLANTLVVFTADQGFSMGEHGFRTKLAPYDANYRSPLIVSRPGTLPQGKVSPQCVNGADLVVTFFKMAGFELPWRMHGRDISALLRDPEHAEWPYPCFYELTGHHFGSDVTRLLAENGPAQHSEVPWYVAVRHGRYKYIRYLSPDVPEELYDLQADPEELVNLAQQPDRQSLLPPLRQKLIEELRHSEAGFVDRL